MPATGAARWVVVEQATPDLLADSPDARVALAFDGSTGVVCRFGVGDDAVDPIATAIASEPPTPVPDPAVLAAPEDLHDRLMLHVSGFHVAPRLAIATAEETRMGGQLLAVMIETFASSAPVSEVDPEDWRVLLVHARAFLATTSWTDRGEAPFLFAPVDDDAVRVGVVMGQAETSCGLMLFPDLDSFDGFMDDADIETTAELPLGAIVFTADVDDRYDGVLGFSRTMGWPDDDDRVPLVLRWEADGPDVPSTEDVQLMTGAIAGITALSQSGGQEVFGETELASGTVLAYSVLDLAPPPTLTTRKSRNPARRKKRTRAPKKR